MNKREAKRHVCNVIAATIINDIDIDAGYIYGRHTEKDSDRIVAAIRELAGEMEWRGEYHPVGLVSGDELDSTA